MLLLGKVGQEDCEFEASLASKEILKKKVVIFLVF
jgi:hypothetical protein